VATAVFDGASAVMPPAEAAADGYPREAVNIMGRIPARVEPSHAASPGAVPALATARAG